MRGALWMSLLQIDKSKAVHSQDLYQNLIQFDNPKVEYDIIKDVPRTMSDLKLWTEDSESG